MQIAGYLGRSETFEEAIADFAVAYAEQNDSDFRALQAALASGRLPSEPGPA